MCENVYLESAFKEFVMLGTLAFQLRICLKLFFGPLKRGISFLTVVHWADTSVVIFYSSKARPYCLKWFFDRIF